MVEFRGKKKRIKKIRVKNCMGVAEEVLRKKKKKERRRVRTIWSLEEAVGIKNGKK